jgi:ABC-2 type transport system ATP-binding protein
MTNISTQNEAIHVDGLHKYYKKLHAVQDVSFSVLEGDFFAFLGPNGAGKTSTIHCITGLANYSQGNIRVHGHDVVSDYRQARRLVGLCGQEFNFDPFLDIFQLLVYQAGYFGIAGAEACDRAEVLLKRFKLWQKKKEDFKALSGGMKRRLLICRALVHDPRVLILDEPTAGADLELRHHIWDYLKEINAQGVTVFLTTHYMEEAEALSKTIAIIHQGKIARIGDKKEVLQGRSLENVFLELTKSED